MPPGPPPKRDAERRRRNARAVETTTIDIDTLPAEDENSLPFLIKQPIVIPEPPEDTEWHAVARMLWDACKRSGQALLWEPTDWAWAYLVCESLSRDLNPQVVGISPANEFGPAEVVKERIPLKGASLGAYQKAAASLMLLEGDRRRLSIELERHRDAGDAKPAEVVDIKDRRKALLQPRAVSE